MKVLSFNPDGNTLARITARLNDQIEYKQNGTRGAVMLRCLGNTMKRLLCQRSDGRLVYIDPDKLSVLAVYRNGVRQSGEPIKTLAPRNQ
jgi:hypothetical protein